MVVRGCIAAGGPSSSSSSSSSSSCTESSSAMSCRWGEGCRARGGLSSGAAVAIGGTGGDGGAALPSAGPHQGRQHFQTPTSVAASRRRPPQRTNLLNLTSCCSSIDIDFQSHNINIDLHCTWCKSHLHHRHNRRSSVCCFPRLRKQEVTYVTHTPLARRVLYKTTARTSRTTSWDGTAVSFVTTPPPPMDADGARVTHTSSSYSSTSTAAAAAAAVRRTIASTYLPDTKSWGSLLLCPGAHLMHTQVAAATVTTPGYWRQDQIRFSH